MKWKTEIRKVESLRAEASKYFARFTPSQPLRFYQGILTAGKACKAKADVMPAALQSPQDSK